MFSKASQFLNEYVLISHVSDFLLQQKMEPTFQETVGHIKCAYFDRVESLKGFGQKNKESLADLLTSFFEYWAFGHDYSHSVVSIRTGRFLRWVSFIKPFIFYVMSSSFHCILMILKIYCNTKVFSIFEQYPPKTSFLFLQCDFSLHREIESVDSRWAFW